MLINKRIGAIEVDTAFADHEQAYELLELVCNDVKEVMDEYDLQVSQIIEMTDDTLDLGYNENETLGWIKIRVRRTRNNQAFQSESMVMDTLLHELAHNRYLGHGEDFNEFFSELKLSLEGRTNSCRISLPHPMVELERGKQH
ncbi:hypothetical protein EV182_003791 [Spiromyces aspiralis]|uniref:Uncharacterized protein n=1 Tax=Spiromyces aspiralis TaxID=68401 RepID=A0ACC1HPY2_9FUNG|nr:hypothetical protein EV182_003791 [Spiromyces aspiralis]